jgi:hypothetical protein
MPKTLAQPKPSNPRWTPFQRRTWLATQRRRTRQRQWFGPMPAVLVFGVDGTTNGGGNLLDLSGSARLAYPNGSPPAYIADWTDQNAQVTPHCIVSNRSGAFFGSDAFPTPNGGSKGTIALKILLPLGGDYHAFAPYWGNWSMNMAFIGSGAVVGAAGDAIYLQMPIGSFITSILSFPNDGLFHWVVFRWDSPHGFYDVSLDALTETVKLADYSGQVFSWPSTVTFQSEAPWESAAEINVISWAGWWDAPLTDFEKDHLIST